MPTFEELAKQRGVQLTPLQPSAPSLSTAPPTQAGGFEELAGQRGVSLSTQPTSTVPAKKESPGFLSRVGTDLSKRAGELGGALKASSEFKQNPLETGIQGAGAIYGAVGDVGSELFSSLTKTIGDKLVGPKLQEWAKANPKAAKNLLGVMQGMQQTNPIVPVAEGAAKINAALPENIQKDIKGLGGIASGVSTIMGAKELLNVGKKAYENIRPLEAQTKSAVDDAISKGLKPSAKGTSANNAKYQAKAREAFRVIDEYKPTFVDDAGNAVTRNPANRKEMLEAIGQSKNRIFTEYDDLASKAGDLGAKYNAEEVIKSLQKVTKDKSYNPDIRGYAEKLIDDVAELNGASPSVVQSRIQDLNSNLGGFYDGRIGKAKDQLDASVANLLREKLDDQINSLTGANYQSLKNKYGALSTIEKDVARQVAVEARKNPGSLLDYTDVFTGGDLLAGIATQNPAFLAKGLAGKALKEYLKYINNPNNYIKKAFDLLSATPAAVNPVNLLPAAAVQAGRSLESKPQDRSLEQQPIQTGKTKSGVSFTVIKTP